jgi:hypothetical protein
MWQCVLSFDIFSISQFPEKLKQNKNGDWVYEVYRLKPLIAPITKPI